MQQGELTYIPLCCIPLLTRLIVGNTMLRSTSSPVAFNRKAGRCLNESSVSGAFLRLLYTWSNCAITQERPLVVGFERCSTETGKSEIAQNRKLLQDGLPKYRETKPETGAEVYSRNSAVVHVLPQFSERFFIPQAVSRKLLHNRLCALEGSRTQFGTVAFDPSLQT